VLNQEGTIDKAPDDAVMAWFNAPIPQPDALRAVRTANIRAAVQPCTRTPRIPLSFSVGIHYGESFWDWELKNDWNIRQLRRQYPKRIQENSATNQVLISEAAALWS
jgi:hypothetical protein